eukprot:EG_transcript_22250
MQKWVPQSSIAYVGQYSSGDFSLNWLIQDLTIQLTMTMKTTGYVSIGFSDWAGVMGPADAYAGWVDGNGQVQAVDFSTRYRDINSLDAQQDVQAVSGSRDSSGVLKVTFSRRLDTQDSQDRVIGRGSTNLLYCWHPSAPTVYSGGQLGMAKHSRWGSAVLDFFAQALSIPISSAANTTNTTNAGTTGATGTNTSNGSTPGQANSTNSTNNTNANPTNATNITGGDASRIGRYCSGAFCLGWSLGSTDITFTMVMQTT